MLSTVTIKSFRCLRSVSVPLKPLTVLIGPNDSGKSAFLTALKHLAGRRAVQQIDFWRSDPATAARITGSTRNGEVAIHDGTVVGAPKAAIEEIHPVAFYILPAEGVRLLGSGLPDSAGPPVIDTAGEQIPALLDYFLRRDRDRFNAVVAAMKKRVPGLADIHVGTPDPAKRRVDLELEEGLVLPPEKVSVGVRLLLFFVALAYHPSPPRLILLEEPENGVHPKRLGDLVALLRDMTKGLHGEHAAQVILSTHSPYLLDHINLDEDQVLVFQRKEDGSRSARPADAERLKTFLDEFMLGEVWYNQGEEGLVKKAP